MFLCSYIYFVFLVNLTIVNSDEVYMFYQERINDPKIPKLFYKSIAQPFKNYFKHQTYYKLNFLNRCTIIM